MPSASIIIPAHNEEFFLPALLESLNAFGKHLRDIEITVVDNGSSDNTSAIAASFGVNIINIPEKVIPSQARNIGASNVSADILIFLDADIVITESWAIRVGFLIREKNTKYLLTGDTYDLSTQPSWIENIWFSAIYTAPREYLQGGNIIISASLFNKLDGFDDKLETGEDVDLCKRATALGVNIFFDRKLRAHHEGYPKSIRNFVRREIWHGTGDTQTWANFVNSKVALTASLFTLTHIALCVALMYYPVEQYISLVSVAGAMIIFLATLPCIKKIKADNFLYFPALLLIGYLYLVGRSISIIKRLI